MTARDIVMGAAGNSGDSKTYIEDVFSTYLYTGDGGLQSINNGIDLAGKGGMVWTKARSGTSATASHGIADTARGASQMLRTNLTNASVSSIDVYAFNSNGFDVVDTANKLSNGSGTQYASWTFRKAPKFFDVVTYTGNGADQNINHSLGSTPGMIIIKSISTSGTNWSVWHRSVSDKYLLLNSTQAAGNAGASRSVTGSIFQVFGSWPDEGYSGQTYVAYLFAHDTTTDGLIQCGSFTTDGSGNATVNLGWEPQYLMVKNTVTAQSWIVFDNMRGIPTGGNDAALYPNLSSAEETTTDFVNLSATGFTGKNFVPSNTYIYMAIRRGPMRTPTDGTQVFKTSTGSNTGSASTPEFSAGFPVDFAMLGVPSTGNSLWKQTDRLRGAAILDSTSTSAEVSNANYTFDYSTGFFRIAIGSSYRAWMFQRAPGFFDVVCYTGTGTSQNINHNLGVAPELMIVKSRSAAVNWLVCPANISATQVLVLNKTDAIVSQANIWNNTQPTTTTFTVGTNAGVNASAGTYVAYLFASCPGVSKVGTYTGNGSSQTINCGFSAGARFVLIKRTDSTGDWYVWDTARGIVASNDPHLSLNAATAEVTTDDTIDPDSTGFIVNQVTATNVNVSGGSYIYLAIA